MAAVDPWPKAQTSPQTASASPNEWFSTNGRCPGSRLSTQWRWMSPTIAFIGSRNPAKLMVLDTDTAKIVTSLEGVEGVGHTDDLWYDGAQKCIYMSGGMARSAFLSSATWIIMPL
jgi:hypothetical protein